jgi:hypothetical protein
MQVVLLNLVPESPALCHHKTYALCITIMEKKTSLNHLPNFRCYFQILQMHLRLEQWVDSNAKLSAAVNLKTIGCRKAELAACIYG